MKSFKPRQNELGIPNLSVHGSTTKQQQDSLTMNKQHSTGLFSKSKRHRNISDSIHNPHSIQEKVQYPSHFTVKIEGLLVLHVLTRDYSPNQRYAQIFDIYITVG